MSKTKELLEGLGNIVRKPSAFREEKFVYENLDSDWIYADIAFSNIDEGPLTFQGWQSPWTPTSDSSKTGISYIDALLPSDPIRWNSDTFYDEQYSNNGSTVLTFSFPGTIATEPKFVEEPENNLD